MIVSLSSVGVLELSVDVSNCAVLTTGLVYFVCHLIFQDLQYQTVRSQVNI